MGTLYVVSTPIGNLEDMSARAKEVLARADVVACEDTRVTGKLLRRFGIRARSISYHEHNEAERTGELLGRLEEGKDVALVSDAGTPLVSDPGYRLVRAARQAGISVRAIPGPSAVLAALAVSGLPTSRFTFAGFLPAKGAAREKAVAELASYDHTVVLFESGTRIARLLDELSRALGSREATLLREMTKLHEEHLSGTLADLGFLGFLANFQRRDHSRDRGEGAGFPGPDFSFFARAPVQRASSGGSSPREPRRSSSLRSMGCPRERSITSSPESRRARDESPRAHAGTRLRAGNRSLRSRLRAFGFHGDSRHVPRTRGGRHSHLPLRERGSGARGRVSARACDDVQGRGRGSTR